MPRYMLDTNICVYLMKHQPPQVRERFAACYVGDVVISAITLAELEFGVACSPEAQARNQAALASLLEDIQVAPFEAAAARAYGPLRAQHRERNRNALDKLIAAHAMALQVVLVTNNESDFLAFPGLVVENWVNSH
ncbi:MAG: type II toxin-antitoxin system VapC family toxin [Curvibacter lanceolatus]|uniref:type II toxin-antitoxin system VapC family toxin n=1 Tax=Curvibacter lanceolatus TaxID=86182 RepID=UPI0004CF7D5D|nr:type II toxin-antitoxin system VapC family toxin [Curvibacter lanceolatus]MBV5295265.1 type II toxin-antitoxin system VapC family toxin [Curvibacter lanceolatus]